MRVNIVSMLGDTYMNIDNLIDIIKLKFILRQFIP